MQHKKSELKGLLVELFTASLYILLILLLSALIVR